MEAGRELQDTLTYDVVVVGAGPAGSSAAASAAKRGLKVALIEQEEAVCQHVRTSGVSWISDMNELGIPKELYNRIERFRFVSGSNDVQLSCKEDAACVLDVRKTFQYLAERAATNGTDIFLSTRAIRPIVREDGKVQGLVASSRGGRMVRFLSSVTIDASGFHSVLASGLLGSHGWERFGVGAEYEAYAENVEADQWCLMLGNDYSPAGYAWVFPVSQRKVRIGVGIGRPYSDVNPVERLDELIRKRKGPLAKLGRISPIEFHFGMVPNQGLRNRMSKNGFAVVGDSAGQANPLVLEGIRYAIRYGSLCGEAAAEQVIRNEKDLLDKLYERKCRSEIQNKINIALRVQERWLSLDDGGWDKEVEILRELSCDEFLDFIKAEFKPGIVMKMVSRHPSFAARELFGIVKSYLGF